MMPLILGIFPLACKTRERALTEESQNLSSDKAGFVLSGRTPYNAELPLVFIPEKLLAQDGSSLALTGGEGELVSEFVRGILARVLSQYEKSAKPSREALPRISEAEAAARVGQEKVALFSAGGRKPIQVVVTREGDEILFKAEEDKATLIVPPADDAEKVSHLPANFELRYASEEELAKLNDETKTKLFMQAIEEKSFGGYRNAMKLLAVDTKIDPQALKLFLDSLVVLDSQGVWGWENLVTDLIKRDLIDSSMISDAILINNHRAILEPMLIKLSRERKIELLAKIADYESYSFSLRRSAEIIWKDIDDILSPEVLKLFFRLTEKRILGPSFLEEMSAAKKQQIFSEALRLGEDDTAVGFLKTGLVKDLANSQEFSAFFFRQHALLFDLSIMPLAQRNLIFKALVQPSEKVAESTSDGVLGVLLHTVRNVDPYYFALPWELRKHFFYRIQKKSSVFFSKSMLVLEGFEALRDPFKLFLFLPKMSPEEIGYFISLKNLPKLTEAILRDKSVRSPPVVAQEARTKFNESFTRAVGAPSDDPVRILNEAEKKGLLSIPMAELPPRKSLVRDEETRPLGEILEKYTLEDLFGEYELFAIGQSLAKDLDPQDLAGTLGEFRALIAKKISAEEIAKLSREEQVRLRPLIKNFKNNVSAVQFSNAVAYAHRLGMTGKGVRVVVVEEVLSEDAKRFKKSKGGEIVSESNTGEAHGMHVTGIVQQLAPDADLRIVGGDQDQDLAKTIALHPEGIINASFSSRKDSTETVKALTSAVESRMLVVKSAGNDGVSYDLERDNPQREADQNYLTDLGAEKKGRLILVGNLEAGNLVARSSSVPGDSPLQANFLWTLGSDVLSYSRPGLFSGAFRKMSGTSMAAPVVSGAAALVKSKYSHFTPKELREVLLESADRDFWMQRDGLAIHVVEPGRARIAGETAGTVEWAFNPHVFGKGILNVRRALDYAYFKDKYQLDPESIRAILAFKEQRVATKIQRWFRSRPKKTS